MSYRVFMELFPKPDDVPSWMWEEKNEDFGRSPQNAHATYKSHEGGKAWTATISGSVFEYTASSAATTKMTELSASSSTLHGNRRFKVVEVV